MFDALVDIELKKEFCKETLSWAVHCGQRHYAGRSFEVRWNFYLNLYCFYKESSCKIYTRRHTYIHTKNKHISIIAEILLDV